MFEDLQKDQNNKVDDIFADSDKSESQPVNKAPMNFNAQSSMKGAISPSADGLSEFEEEDDNKSGKIIKTIFLIIFIFAIIGIAGYFVYSKILLPKTLNQNNPSQENVIIEDKDVINENINNESNDAEIIATTSEEEIIENEAEEDLGTTTLETVDSDIDGITDYDEIYLYGTNPYIIDTDGDGLGDHEEIMIFGTDPLNPDTDSDTYLDGQEIISGYNPFGGGKINIDLFVDKNLFIEKYPELAIK
ncbi:MAG TPA: hypothetical protein PK142_01495 [bacterium]|nr:hypothetical protein [bacterium]